MKLSLSIFFIVFLLFPAGCGDPEPPPPWSVRIGESFMERHQDGIMQVDGKTDTAWTYEQGLMLEAFRQLGLHAGQERYHEFLQRNLEHYVREDGTIRSYRIEDYNLDMVAGGRGLLFLWEETGQEKFRAAAGLLRKQLSEQPRTKEGGFWHKKIYPYQMWLDGLYMAEPFYTRYAVLFDEPQAFDDIVNQFVFVYRHTRDSVTGLCYHGWDESRGQPWADPVLGHSPTFWGRAMGWYMMALVDVLDDFPAEHPRRGEMVQILKELSEALLAFQDRTTGMWYQVVDQADRPGNYLESSASGMFAYAFAKGANRGYLDPQYFDAAEAALEGIIRECVSEDRGGQVDLHDTCRGAGLGGNPYRDGSFAYYVGVPRATNDLKGIGPLLLAAIQVEKGRARTAENGSGNHLEQGEE